MIQSGQPFQPQRLESLINVTSAVSASGGQLMSLGIDSTGSDGLDVYSKENSANKPELVVNFN
ncbi:hypothetical protein A2954_01550 [Candidatus Roizmanbacteria bacterium RIFCSPLOWO2_01_FULL_37_12]|uniref:Uncharacterized protein n=1 Tax=Candidatus Roizmanbacteria bacterium RIFCSPLOWO2_01_FULL_37_12 TaxID=1802056 RepID=A0A1F7I9Z8_9BACT|nr:MAG: hypothetical protein A3D76_00555 [Candidatus Roizmanbacteria bacterium RIFCSPHIGHO2_02_FULL_37_9b]OGK40180.1 MAG: hypothetical protein A2954_01550 [Candidatus Roizmanbacteria bacterium RIFCSPLOWO2_01_FULL_37_12]